MPSVNQDEVSFIHVNHEECGGFAAVGQAKLTGKLGVLRRHPGPGAIHLLNALYDAAATALRSWRSPARSKTG